MENISIIIKGGNEAHKLHTRASFYQITDYIYVLNLMCCLFYMHLTREDISRSNKNSGSLRNQFLSSYSHNNSLGLGPFSFFPTFFRQMIFIYFLSVTEKDASSYRVCTLHMEAVDSFSASPHKDNYALPNTVPID